MKDTPWSLSGPPRTLTRSALMLTKRGTGSPLVTASLPARVGPTADVNVNSAANRPRNQAIIGLPCRTVAAASPTLVRHAVRRTAPGALRDGPARLVQRR